MLDVVLPRRVTPQPLPQIVEGGDCGPCVLSGLTGLGVQEVYDFLRTHGNHEIQDAIKRGLSRYSMRIAIGLLRTWRIIEDYIDHVPVFLVPAGAAIWGHPSWQNSHAWFVHIRTAMMAGYYPVCAVAYERNGPMVFGDHWVLLCGAREKRIECQLSTGGASTRIIPEVLVSNSSVKAESEEWVEATEFLKRWGGFNALLVKPWQKEEQSWTESKSAGTETPITSGGGSVGSEPEIGLSSNTGTDVSLPATDETPKPEVPTETVPLSRHLLLNLNRMKSLRRPGGPVPTALFSQPSPLFRLSSLIRLR